MASSAVILAVTAAAATAAAVGIGAGKLETCIVLGGLTAYNVKPTENSRRIPGNTRSTGSPSVSQIHLVKKNPEDGSCFNHQMPLLSSTNSVIAQKKTPRTDLKCWPHPFFI